MADIRTIAGKLSCGQGDTPNTGRLGCLSLFSTPDHLLGVKKGFKIPANTVFDLAYLTPLIQDGTIVPLIDSSTFEDVSAEDAYSTNSSGVKRLNLKGLPEYKFVYEEGHELYRQLDRFTSFKELDFIIGDISGNWMMVVNSDGSYGGFTAGHTTAELRKNQIQGGDAESRSLMIQFLDRAQFDRNYTILHQDQLDFVPSDVPSINGAHIEYVTIPSAGAGVVVDITVHLNSDHNTIVTGLLTGDLLVTVNGVTNANASFTETPNGTYAITLTDAISAGETITVSTFDGAVNSNVSDVSGVLFRGEVSAEVLA